MAWRWAGRTAAALLLVAAGVLLTRSVSTGPAAAPVSCGSAWDVLTGRTDWSVWWSQDGAAPAATGRPLRTQQCPGAVDGRLTVAGVLVALGVVAAAAGELPRARRGAAPAAEPSTRRLRRVGTVLVGGGSVAGAAGLVALLVLTGNPHAAMFDYVDRSTVLLAGLLLLLPAALLAGLGALARTAARVLEERRAPP